jgi:hypothetical protein
VEPEDARRVCLCADEAIRTDFCVGFDLDVAMSLRVAAGLCEGTGAGELAGATGLSGAAASAEARSGWFLEVPDGEIRTRAVARAIAGTARAAAATRLEGRR